MHSKTLIRILILLLGHKKYIMRSVRPIIEPSQFNSSVSQTVFGIGNTMVLDDRSERKALNVQMMSKH